MSSVLRLRNKFPKHLPFFINEIFYSEVSKYMVDSGVSIVRTCELMGLSQANYYRETRD